MSETVHQMRYPNETAEYRAKRDELLRAEMDLRAKTEEVAALRRGLPPGGRVTGDYVFESRGGPRRLAELFAPGKDTLLLYSYMYGPEMKEPCSSCTCFLDALDGEAPHVAQRVNLAVVAKSPLERILAFTEPRGWRHLELLSSEATTYHRDYLGEGPDGGQWPMLNVFVKRGDEIFHSWGAELLFAPKPKGTDARHIETYWPLWNLLDLTPEGRGTNWYPRLQYQ